MDGVFRNGNDAILGGTASSIGRVTVGNIFGGIGAANHECVFGTGDGQRSGAEHQHEHAVLEFGGRMTERAAITVCRISAGR